MNRTDDPAAPHPHRSGAGPLPDDIHAAGASTLAADLVACLAGRSLTIATCESLTGGGVCAALTSVPGSSRAVRGGLVTYASDLKVSLAGVDAGRVAREGVINEATAVQMARGALAACRSHVAVSCTGVAGPDGQDGHEPGEVWVGLAMRDTLADASPVTVASRRLQLAGDRHAIRQATIVEALRFVLDRVH